MVGKCRLSINYDCHRTDWHLSPTWRHRVDCHRIDLSPIWVVTDLTGTHENDLWRLLKVAIMPVVTIVGRAPFSCFFEMKIALMRGLELTRHTRWSIVTHIMRLVHCATSSLAPRVGVQEQLHNDGQWPWPFSDRYTRVRVYLSLRLIRWGFAARAAALVRRLYSPPPQHNVSHARIVDLIHLFYLFEIQAKGQYYYY